MSVRTLTGDCRDILPTLDAESVDCIVTSPPYWGLRDYGVAGQIGLEPTLEAYVETMAQVGRELWRVLKPSGTFWLNIGDSYAATSRSAGASMKSTLATRPTSNKTAAQRALGSWKTDLNGLKSKDLCLVPERLALRLQADGWWIRSRIIWAKQNPMPESVTDRPTSAHEHVWMLTKAATYWYDADAIAEQATARETFFGSDAYSKGSGRNDSGQYNAKICETRNARNVWSIASQPFPGSHFATMPPVLAERCIKAGCPIGGTVLDPFFGAGTTGLVADRLGRNCVGIELNTSYVGLAQSRIKDDAPLFADVEGAA